MEKADVKRWKENADFVNAFILEEKRNRTPEERIETLNAFVREAKTWGISLPPSDYEFHIIWNEIRMRIIERNSR